MGCTPRVTRTPWHSTIHVTLPLTWATQLFIKSKSVLRRCMLQWMSAMSTPKPDEVNEYLCGCGVDSWALLPEGSRKDVLWRCRERCRDHVWPSGEWHWRRIGATKEKVILVCCLFCWQHQKWWLEIVLSQVNANSGGRHWTVSTVRPWPIIAIDTVHP